MTEIKLVTYDLHKPNKDYEKLFEILKTYSWAHPLDSVWFLKTESSCGSIRDKLKQYVDEDDSIIVVGVNGWATLKISKDVTDWLNR